MEWKSAIPFITISSQQPSKARLLLHKFVAIERIFDGIRIWFTFYKNQEPRCSKWRNSEQSSVFENINQISILFNIINLSNKDELSLSQGSDDLDEMSWDSLSWWWPPEQTTSMALELFWCKLATIQFEQFNAWPKWRQQSYENISNVWKLMSNKNWEIPNQSRLKCGVSS